jgi:hypothetical protein
VDGGLPQSKRAALPVREGGPSTNPGSSCPTHCMQPNVIFSSRSVRSSSRRGNAEGGRRASQPPGRGCRWGSLHTYLDGEKGLSGCEANVMAKEQQVPKLYAR